jgi:hypothetical protein
MEKDELLQLIGSYGGCRGDAEYHASLGETIPYEANMRKSLTIFEKIAKELDKLYE